VALGLVILAEADYLGTEGPKAVRDIIDYNFPRIGTSSTTTIASPMYPEAIAKPAPMSNPYRDIAIVEALPDIEPYPQCGGLGLMPSIQCCREAADISGSVDECEDPRKIEVYDMCMDSTGWWG
jgi:hypothetical protein